MRQIKYDLPRQLSRIVRLVDHDLLVALSPGGHPVIVDADALDVVRVVLDHVHLDATLAVPRAEAPVQAGGVHHASVQDTDALSAILVTLQQPKVGFLKAEFRWFLLT